MKRYCKKEHEEKMTAEEYRSLAEEYRKEVQGFWKIFGITGILMLAVLGVAAALCVAWFASNDTVTSRGMGVQSAIERKFELAAEGNTGAWDGEKLSSIPSGAMESISGKSLLRTGNDAASIRWAVTKTSNMDNYEKTGISPGSEGKITFYIIPSVTGKLEVTLNLSLIGKKDEGMEESDLTDSEMQLMRGHILLFAGYDADKCSYSGWINEDADAWKMELHYGEKSIDLSRNEDGSLSWSGEVEENTAYPVTIYWIWPEIFGQYVLKDIDSTGNRPVLFPEDGTEGNAGNPSALPDGLFSKMCQAEEGARFNSYFRWAIYDNDEEQKKEFQKNVNEENLEQLRAGTLNGDIYEKMCDYYNMADQYIGCNVRYLYLQLDAE